LQVLIIREKKYKQEGYLNSMQRFLDTLKKSKYLYIIAVSLVTTIILINSVSDFTDRIKNNKFLIVLSLVIFYFFVVISIKEEIWKNGK